MTLPSELPWSWGTRRHAWLWAAISLNNSGEDTPLRLKTMVGEYKTKEQAEAAAKKYMERGYYTTVEVIIEEPTEEPPVFKTQAEARAAAELIPITLYTVDCPICGEDVMANGEYSCAEPDTVSDALYYHMEEEHGDLPEDDDDATDA